MKKPNMGGGTIFLDLGIQAKPVKNSAVFWYNYLPNGISDDDTNHAACPVNSFRIWFEFFWLTPSLSGFKIFNGSTLIIRNWLFSRLFGKIFRLQNIIYEYKRQFLSQKFLINKNNYLKSYKINLKIFEDLFLMT